MKTAQLGAASKVITTESQTKPGMLPVTASLECPDRIGADALPVAQQRRKDNRRIGDRARHVEDCRNQRDGKRGKAGDPESGLQH